VNIAGPRSLRDHDEILRRQELLLSSPSAAPLTRWLDEIVEHRRSVGLPAEMPYVDPMDAGVGAKVLIILEAPGPKTNAFNSVPGSGFISSDNDDTTAENLWLARRDAGLIDGVLIWNAVPWYLGPTKRKPRVAEQQVGGAILRDLIGMLPELHTVVPLGRHARDTWRRFARPDIGMGVRTVESHHSGAQAMIQPGLRAHLHAALRRAADDWRSVSPDGSGTPTSDFDKSGERTALWFLDAQGDRIDIHPRWW
jgi:hypothetical protein